MPEPGRAVSGRASIRGELERFVAMRPRMSGRVEKVLEAGDTALVAYRWQLEGTTPDGAPVHMVATSANVLRRRANGSWSVVIDDPYGVAASAGAEEWPGA